MNAELIEMTLQRILDVYSDTYLTGIEFVELYEETIKDIEDE